MRRKRKEARRRRARLAAAALALLSAAGGGLFAALRRRRAGAAGGEGTPTGATTPGPSPAVPAEGETTVESPGGAGGTPVPAGVTPTPAAAEQAVANEWHCESCGQAFRISGEGRHRIYWLPDAAPSDPVVDGRCPSCGTALPGGRPRD